MTHPLSIKNLAIGRLAAVCGAVSLGVAGVISPARAQVEVVAPSTTATTDVNPPPAGAWRATGGTITTVSVNDPSVPFTSAFQMAAPSSVANVYDVQIKQCTYATANIAEGDILWLSFWARPAGDSTTATLTVVLGSNGGSPVYYKVAVKVSGSSWTHVSVPLQPSLGAYPGGTGSAATGTNLSVQTGYANQTVQIGGITLENYGQLTPRGTLPYNWPGTDVVTPPSDPNYLSSYTKVGTSSANFTTVPVNDPDVPFTSAVQVENLSAVTDTNAVQMYVPVPSTFAPVTGDVGLVEFWARCVSPAASGLGTVQLAFQNASRQNLQGFPATFTSTSTWTHFILPCRSGGRYVFNTSVKNIAVLFGFGQQTVQVGGMRVVDFGKVDGTVNTVRYYPTSGYADDLPVPTWNPYAGWEPEAAWRVAANASIEQIRKADVKVTVVDYRGRPAPGASVTIEQQRHGFGFGTAVNSNLVTSGSAQDIYRSKVADPANGFNLGVLENDMKWVSWVSSSIHQRADQQLAWLQSHGMATRGHNLIWPTWQYSPSGVDSSMSPEQLRSATSSHIADEAGTYAGSLVDWDVLNEPYSKTDYANLLATESDPLDYVDMANYFVQAHQADPNARLFLNDVNVLDAQDATRTAWNLALIDYMQSVGAPINGFGFESHFGSTISPLLLKATLDKFAARGLRLEGTEYDLSTTDEQLAAMYIRDYMTVLFAHPNVDAILMWGFWDGSHWNNNAPLYRKDWTLKPSGYMWQNMVRNQWWTNDGTAATSRTGTWSGRGFLGDYVVTVRGTNGVTVTKNVTLTSSGLSLIVVLPPQ